MFLYFADWSTPQNLALLEAAGLPHDNRLIKVFATEVNPTATLKRDITIVEESGDPFTQSYKYHLRGPWLPSELEFYLQYYLGDEAPIRKARALFRFANRPELEIAHFAMEIKNAVTGEMHYSHPLRILDGLDQARERGRAHGLHLDIFTTRTLEKLGKLIDLDDKSTLVDVRENILLSRETQISQQPERR